MHKARRFLEDESGATAIEYCFIAGSIAMAIVISLTSIGTKLTSVFTRISGGLN